MHFNIKKVEQSCIAQVDFQNLVFGKVFSDHMFVADCIGGQWQTPQILPYGKIEMAPSSSVLHHAQAIFEGMKVYKNKKNEILFFRMEDNYNRMNISATRMCMPHIPKEIFIEGLKQLVELDKQFIPNEDGLALYIRPVYFSTDEAIGVKASQNYKFIIFTTPTGPFYSEPLRVYIETKYSRSALGGTGYAKAAGNYGGSFYPTKLAIDKGFHQLIWTDAIHNQYVEESGSMNLFFVFNDTLVTPTLSGSKLAGITRDSILKLANHLNIKTEVREISVTEIIERYNNNELKEAFGAGTAANVAHIKTIGYDESEIIELPPLENRTIANTLSQKLNNIKMGHETDIFGWTTLL
jgi:branched-chain amino acid aminotransferase